MTPSPAAAGTDVKELQPPARAPLADDKRLRAVEHKFFEAKEADATGEEGAAMQLEVVREEYVSAQALSSSAMEYHLHVKKDDDE